MDVWLISAAMPWGAVWIRWTGDQWILWLNCPSLRKKQWTGSAADFKNCHRCRVSRSQFIFTQSRRRTIQASSGLTGTVAIPSQLSLESLHLFSLHDRGGHISARLPLNSPDSDVCSFLERLSKTKQLDDWAGSLSFYLMALLLS